MKQSRITDYISDKIKILSLIAIALVIYIHTGYDSEVCGMTINIALQNLVRNDIARYAVPLFFMISGFLFFQGVDTIRDLTIKIKRRFKSLVIPFFISKSLFLGFCIFMEVVVGDTANYHIVQMLRESSIPEIIYNIYYATEGIPWVMHLWFLRDLIIVILITPVILLLMKYLNKWLLIAILILLTNFQYIPIGPILFFTSGYIIFSYLTNKSESKCWVVILLFMITTTLMYILKNVYFENSEYYISIISTCSLALGACTIWVLYDMVVPTTFSLKEHKYINTFVGFSFFIYLFHVPTIHVMRKIMILFLGNSSITYAIVFLFAPYIFIMLFSLVGLFFKRYIPNVYSIIVGGR